MKMRKLLAMVLAAAMVLVMLPVTGWAADAVYNTADAEAVNRILSKVKWPTSVQPGFSPSTWSFVNWSLDDTNKRVIGLYLRNSDYSGWDLSGKDISEELSVLTELVRLDCRECNLEKLDVSQNKKLEWLYCPDNKLTELDISGNTALETVYCYDNELTSLNVADLPKLELLECSGNHLTALDTSGCTALTDLYCENNNLISLDISDCTKLIYLNCEGNSLSTLNLSGQTELSRLFCSNNQLTSLNLSKQSKLEVLDCRVNQLKSLNLSNPTELFSLSCRHNQLTTLDLSKQSKLRSLECSENQLTSLILSNQSELTALTCYENQLTSLNLSNQTKLLSLFCAWNNLTSLDLTDCPEMENLSCVQNMMPNEDALIGFKGAVSYNFYPQKEGYGDSTGNSGGSGGNGNSGSTVKPGGSGSGGQTSTEKKEYKVYCNGGYEVFNVSLEDVTKTSSSTYNPQLAHMLIAMCNSVFNNSEMTDTFNSFGFEKKFRFEGSFLTYSMAKKQLQNETLVLVSIRGSQSAGDWISNFDAVTNENGLHGGFADSAYDLYNNMKEFLGNDLSNTRFVITGFSRGAAVANILAAKLVDERIAQSKIYAYAFACPDVGKISESKAANYSCIFNVADINDLVSWTPSYELSNNWYKFGKSYWYCHDWSDYQNIGRNISAHNQAAYLDYLRSEKATGFVTRTSATNIINDAIMRRAIPGAKKNGPYLIVACPIDLEIYTADGTLVGSVIDNVPDVISEEDLYIYVEDSQKHIFFSENGEYTVKFTATDDGAMEYIVQNLDVISGTLSGEKVFKNVPLTKEKKLVSYVNVEDKTDTSAVRLFVLNDDGEPGEEILPGDNSPSNNGATSKSTAKEEKDSNSYNYQAEQEALKAIKAANAGKSTSRVQTYPTAAGADVPAVTVKLYGWGAGLSLETMRTLAEGTTGLRVNLNNGAAQVLIPAGFTMPNIPGVLGYNLAYQKDPWQSSLMKALVKDPDANTETHLLGGGELPTAATVTLKTGLTGTVNVYHWDPTTRRVTFLAAGSAESGRVTFATKQLGNLILTDGTI